MALLIRKCTVRTLSSAAFVGKANREMGKSTFSDVNCVLYKQRRSNLANAITQLSPNMSHAVVVPGLGMSYSAPDVPHLFRQKASFRYLTGITDPNACLLIWIQNPGFRIKSTVFIEQTSEDIRIWEGKRLDSQLATSTSGADEALPINEFSSTLQQILTPAKSVALWFDDYNVNGGGMPPIPLQLRSLSSFGPCQSVSSLIHRFRLIKSPEELALMRHVCSAAAGAMMAAARHTPQAAVEFSLESAFEHAVKTQYDCRKLSFPPVVGSGENATVLHYLSNEKALVRGDAVLMDAGCEYHGYCSDMSRVWPIGGKFSSAQRILYEGLLSVHKECLKMIMPGVSLEMVYTKMLDMIGIVVKETGIIKKSSPLHNLPFAAIGRRVCPHHVSHHLGLDVHDCSLISRSEALLSNSVVTVEPGIYIRSEWKKDYHEEFCGIGMRLEDDVVVPNSNNEDAEILTHEFPLELAEVEKLSSGKV